MPYYYKITLLDPPESKETIMECGKNLTDKELSDIVEEATNKVIRKALKEKNEEIFNTTAYGPTYENTYEPMLKELEKMGFKEIKINAEIELASFEPAYDNFPDYLTKKIEKYTKEVNSRKEE